MYEDGANLNLQSRHYCHTLRFPYHHLLGKRFAQTPLGQTRTESPANILLQKCLASYQSLLSIKKHFVNLCVFGKARKTIQI